MVVLLALTGCARWARQPAGDGPALSLPKRAPDTVVLDVHFVRVPREQAALADRLWQEVDEQAVAAAVRRRLAENGFRCGLVGQVLPATLQEVLDRLPATEGPSGESAALPAEDVTVRTQRMHNRTGHPGKIVVRSDAVPRMAALLRDEDGRIQGRTLQKAQLFLRAQTRSQPGGSVRLELTPVIEHGEPRSAYAVQQGVWTLDSTRRATEVYDELKIDVVLTPGQSILLTGTACGRGLGHQFFGADPTDGSQDALVLLIRLQQAQLDVRFDGPTAGEPISSYAD